MAHEAESSLGKWMPGTTVTLAAAVVLLHFLPGAAAFAQAVTCPETPAALATWWSGHLVHWTGAQLFWDLLMFLGLGLWLELREKRNPLPALLLGAPVIVGVTAVVCPDIAVYRGLSGLDCLLGGLLCACWLRRPAMRWLGWGFGGLLVGKALLEMGAPGAMFAGNMGPGVRPLAIAHLAGFAFGLFWEWQKGLRFSGCFSRRREA